MDSPLNGIKTIKGKIEETIWSFNELKEVFRDFGLVCYYYV